MEWKSIETAPKGDRDILTFGEWGVVTAMWDGEKWVTGFEGVLAKANMTFGFHPTHWMPLPPPPSADQ